VTECTTCSGETHPEERITSRYRGTTYAFYSDECKEEFEAMSESFVDRAGGGMRST
jgi:YHS domain-containing protein